MNAPGLAWPREWFADRVVLVTGASRGIGAGIARAFHRAGARVVLASRSDIDAAGVLGADPDGRALCVAADLTRAGDIDKLFARIREAHGTLDALVNNAGLQCYDPISAAEAATWQRSFDTNVTGAALAINAAAALMGERGGAIVNIASINALRAGPTAVYSASKAALLALTRSAALTLGPSVRVNAVSPGLIDRPGLREQWPEGVEQFERDAPMRAIGTPEDVANACLFLCSPAARWITGENLVVDGGMTAA